MAVAFVRDHVAEFVKTAGTTDTYATTSIVPAGNLLVMSLVHDTFGVNTPTVTSISKPASETASWVFLGRATNSAGSAGSNANGELWAIKTTVAWPNATSLTITYSNSITMKAQDILEFSGAEATPRSTVGVQYSGNTTAAAGTTTGTTPVVGDLAIGLLFTSNATSLGGTDNDTTGGPWLNGGALVSTGGSAATNNAGYTFYKI